MEVSSGQKSSDGESGLWWSSWLSSAKEKSINALSATKRDLAEFVSVIGSDTKAAVEGASANINKIIKQSSSDDLEGETNKSKEDRMATRVVQSEAPYDRCQAQLYTLQSSLETYLQDPNDKGSEHIESYESWKSSFDTEDYQSDISDLLVSSQQVRSSHSQLVPARVSYGVFWMRYFYKVQRLQKEEKRREDLMARADNCAKEQIQWDDEVEVPSSFSSGVPSSLNTLKAAASGHQRSESSTDSFVCVSEETGGGSERSPSRAVTAADTESWEQVGGSGSSHESPDGRASDVEGEEDLEKGLDRLFKKHGSHLQCSEEDLTELDNGKTTTKRTIQDGETESNPSDWEKWDD